MALIILSVIFSCLFIWLAYRAVDRIETPAGARYFVAALLAGLIGFGGILETALRMR
jgi:4-hydroxybenzoate polyprenyltransferase